MVRIAGTGLAVIAGMLFGWLLRIGVERWHAGELPLDRQPAHFHFPIVEFALGTIWGLLAWRLLGLLIPAQSVLGFVVPYLNLGYTLGLMLLTFALMGVATVNADEKSFTDIVTLPGVAVGCVFSVYLSDHMNRYLVPNLDPIREFRDRILSAIAAAALVILIQWLCRLTRRLEVGGWGEAHLMAMLAAWLGLEGALLAFTVGALIGLSLFATLWLIPRAWRRNHGWALGRVSVAALLCAGGIVSCLWGPQIHLIALRWSVLSKLALKFP